MFAATALAGCGATAQHIDLCPPNDVQGSLLGPALTGGTLTFSVWDASGALTSHARHAADDAQAVHLVAAAPGLTLEVEGFSSDGTRVAAGTAALRADGTCVCLARIDWSVEARWYDSNGTATIGPTRSRFEVYANAPNGVRMIGWDQLKSVGACSGPDRLCGTARFANLGAAPVALASTQLMARARGAARADAVALATASVSGTIAAHQEFSVTLDVPLASLPGPIAALFARMSDPLRQYDGPDVEVALLPQGLGPQLISIDAQTLTPSGQPSASATFYNFDATPIAVRELALYARGADQQERAFDSPVVMGGALTLQPASSQFDQQPLHLQPADAPCAGVVCTAVHGACAR